jgi:thioredoxin reductase (NADPH)
MDRPGPSRLSNSCRATRIDRRCKKPYDAAVARPAFVVVDDDTDALAALAEALHQRFGAHYQVFAEGSAADGLAALERLRDGGEQVALVIADQWMPEVTGVEFLLRAHEIHPAARRALLVDYFDRGAIDQICKALALGRIDSWLHKPWEPADKHLYLRISELLAEWVAATDQPGFRVMHVVAEPHSMRSHELRDVLDRNDLSAQFVAPDSLQGQHLLEQADQDGSQLPVVVYYTGRVQVDPSLPDIAAALGVRTRPPADHYDVTVIGAGPAGLSAALCSASEGLSTLMLETRTLGGQASSTSMIRNYLGFPRGISGRQLCALAYRQSVMFGATLVLDRATRLDLEGDQRVITLAGGGRVSSPAVVVSVGMQYRRLPAPGVEELLGAGVFYGAAVSEAPAMTGQNVFVVGAGNSAGQAAVHLAKYAEHVTVLVRGNSLAATMSDYLIREIDASPMITVRLNTEVTGADGSERLEHLTLHDAAAGRTETVAAAALFIMIGTRPNTDWLADTVQRDDHGFVLTGTDVARDGKPDGWTLPRMPYPMETSVPGVFAVGDARHGAVNRMASAVGSGSIAVQFVHAYLSEH